MKRTLVLLAVLIGCISATAQNTPSLVQSNLTGSSGASSTLSFSSNVTAGHALYAMMYDGYAPGDTLTFTDSLGNSWTTVKSASLATDGDTIAIGCAIAGTSGADTLTFKVNGAATTVWGSVYEVANSTCTTDVTPVSSDLTSQTACSSGALTTATANDFLVGFCGTQHLESTLTAGSGWIDGTSSAELALGEIEIAGSAGSYTATSSTYPNNGEEATIEAAFKATTSGGGGGGVTGSGTANTVPIFTGSSPSSTLASSVIAQSGSNIGIGTTTPNAPLQINSAEGLIVGSPTYNYSNYATDEAIFAGNIALQNMAAANWLGIEFKGGTQATSPSMFFGLNPSTGLQFLNGSGQAVATIATGGNFGIGTTTPAYNLDVAGAIHTSTALYLPDGTKQTTAWTGVLCGGDYAEAVNAKGSRKSYEPGDVLVIGGGAEGEVEKSAEPYSTMVAGIFATKPGVIGRRQSLLKDAEEIPMAMVGIVPTKATTENGPIQRGDLLVTSSMPGYAMKGTDRSQMLGAVIGKAMGSLDSAEGVIEVLVTLQ